MITEHLVARASRSWTKRHWLAVAMITLGVVLLAVIGGYSIYSVLARSGLGDLEYTVPLEELAPLSEPYTSLEEPVDVSPSGSSSVAILPSSSFISLYPGKLLSSLYWDNPRWTGIPSESYMSLFEGFTPVEVGTLPNGIGVLPAPSRMVIPAIDLDSSVKELEILDLGDAKAYETPKNVVGHIPQSANPGESGNVYLFGHLQSPVKGEGSVFRNLPNIPDILRMGEKVYIILYNEEGTAYLYQVTQTTVVPAEEFFMPPSSEAVVTLVTCVPQYVYSHRLLVTANLVGVKR